MGDDREGGDEMNHRLLHGVSLLTLLIVASSAAYADVASTFDADPEGWYGTNASAVTHMASGGNPGGYLLHDEGEDQVLVDIVAPQEFLGSWNIYENGSIRFDHALFTAVLGDSGGYRPYGITLKGSAQDSAEWIGPTPTDVTDWLRFYVPIRESAWDVMHGTWSELLDNVTEFRIRIEVVAGEDTEGIDNVLLREPAPILVALDGSGDFTTIQEAIDIASDGDVIELADGMYTGDGNRDLDYLGKAITIRSASGNPSACEIDCEGSSGDRHRGVWFQSGEGPGSVLEGIEINHGYAPDLGDGQPDGGAVRIGTLTIPASPTIINCVFSGCIATDDGGAVNIDPGSSPTLTGCVIQYNGSGDKGGGIQVTQPSAPSFIDCHFKENWANTHGGGIFLNNGVSALIESCVFSGKVAIEDGGAIVSWGSNPVITDCLIYSNEAWGDDGGIRVVGQSPQIDRCTFYMNEGANSGGISSLSSANVSVTNTIIMGSVSGAAIYCTTGSVSLDCCDLYDNDAGDFVGCVAGMEGVDGNFSADPLFCDSSPWDDFSLTGHSPCLAGPCGQVGAAGRGCFDTWPIIASITDVGNDQGRQIRLRWERAQYDEESPAGPAITDYGIYRRQDGYRCDGGKLPVPGERSDGWDYLATVPARGDSIYQYIAPTLCDSTVAEGMCWSVFFVSAMTDDPLVYYDSPPDSGYSVDNLAPDPPMNLRWEGSSLLAWDEAEVEDFDYFTIYGSATEVFDETAELIGYTVDTSMDVADEIYSYYHVTTSDFNGNEGLPSSIDRSGADAGEASRIPEALTLWPVRPNPFTEGAAVRFDLPSATPVRLQVFDPSGRRIATLMDGVSEVGRHMVSWDGRHMNGQRVGAGVYFIKLETPGFEATERTIRVQ